jgi:hypothetical protein
MADFLFYLVKASICSFVFYSFYYIFLRKVSYFTTNRFYLVVSIIASFILPVLHLDFNFISPEISENSFLPELSANNFISDEMGAAKIVEKHFATIDFLAIVYFIGFAIMMLKILTDLVKLFLLVHKSTTIKSCRNILVLADDYKTAFSFFHFIFLDKKRYLENKISGLIIEHEKVHSKQLHSFDLVLAEFYAALLWFNPFAFFHRNSIKVNHEYLADFQVLKSGNCIPEYLSTLANEAFASQMIGLSSNFNCSIKKRLIMIRKNKTSVKHFEIYLFVLPLLCLLIYAFSGAKCKSNLITANLVAINLDDTVPSIYPVDIKNVKKTSGYGYRIHPIYKTKQFHPGIDIETFMGEKVMSTARGIVVIAEISDKGYGNRIVIKHSNVYSTSYCHLKSFAVKVGDKTDKGQVIGYVGNTGLCTGVHLHYEVIKNEIKVDPKDYFK